MVLVIVESAVLLGWTSPLSLISELEIEFVVFPDVGLMINSEFVPIAIWEVSELGKSLFFSVLESVGIIFSEREESVGLGVLSETEFVMT